MNIQIQDSAYGGEGYKPVVMVRLIVKYPIPVLAVVLAIFITIAGGTVWGYMLPTCSSFLLSWSK